MQKSYETLPESFNLNAFEGILNSNSNNDPDETQDPNIVSNVEKSVGAATPVVEHLEPTSSAGSSLIHLTEGDELPGETFRRLNLYDLAEAALQTFEECWDSDECWVFLYKSRLYCIYLDNDRLLTVDC